MPWFFASAFASPVAGWIAKPNVRLLTRLPWASVFGIATHAWNTSSVSFVNSFFAFATTVGSCGEPSWLAPDFEMSLNTSHPSSGPTRMPWFSIVLQSMVSFVSENETSFSSSDIQWTILSRHSWA